MADKNVIKVATALAAGQVSREVIPSSSLAAHIQVVLGTATAIAVEGVILDTDERRDDITEADWSETMRFTSSGIFPVKLLPPVYRFRAIGGASGRIAVIHYKDAKMVPEILPPSVSEINASISPLLAPIQATADNAVGAANAASTTANRNKSLISVASKTALGALAGVVGDYANADGSRWKYVANGLVANNITIVAAPGGGFWQREYAGPIMAAWGNITADGVADDTAAVQALIDATPAKGTTDLRGLSLTIKGIVLLRANVTVDLTGTVITVPAGSVKDFWTAVLVGANVSGWRVFGGEIICNVADAASENDPTTGATAFVQRGLYAAGCTDFVVRDLIVRSPLMDGVRVAENCLRWELNGIKVYHRTGWTDEPAQTARASTRPCIQISSVGYEGAGVFPGTNGTVPSLTRALSLPQTTQRGVIYNCAGYGGTHGILLFNVRNIQVGLCRVENNSHRGIIASPTTDFVTITGCETRNSGSTGIHVANNCTNITISANTVDGVPKGEGDGIKAYVSVEQITISNNIINDVLNCGVRLAWGANYCSITGNIITMNQYGNLGSAGIKIMSRTRAQADGYAAAGVNPATARSWNNTVTGNTIRGARAGVRLGYQTPTNGTAPANNAALCEVRDNIISGNTVYGCMYGVTVYDEEYAESGSSTYIYGNTLRDLRLIAVDHTTNTANASPQFASFVEIMGVPRSGNGWGSSTPIAQKQAGLNVLHGTAATPVATYTGIAAGDRYYNTSTGAQWIFQSGAWKQVTAA